MARKFNFGAGPAVLPVEVVEEARDNLLEYGSSGLGVMEMSHRGKHYMEIQEQAGASIRRLLGADDDWELVWLTGGASTQFFMVPMNLGAKPADYIVTGTWSQKAVVEANKLGEAKVAASSEDTGFDRIPRELELSAGASYVHMTSNNTIYGTQFREAPEVEAPLVCDASSDILSRPLKLERYGLIYAGAQKNLGPAGVTLVLVRKALLDRAPKTLPTMLDYRTHVKKDSAFNTPPTFPIYIVGLVAKWLEAQGGLTAMAARNHAQADKLYGCIDRHDLYRGHAQPDSRSHMNVTFKLAEPEREADFLAQAAERGLLGLKGHRSVGGMRASIYNAMPDEGVDALVAFMDEFAG
ncbi:MAG: 3-phosphoserine/phosphohydroxythreonine transaminase [Planctomycetota bacterium]